MKILVLGMVILLAATLGVVYVTGNGPMLTLAFIARLAAGRSLANALADCRAISLGATPAGQSHPLPRRLRPKLAHAPRDRANPSRRSAATQIQ
ncbi:MAG: hypothetical protein RIC56_07150, partial [Pseudomonadales bacterium]